MAITTTYQRPRTATLIVRTEDGDEWKATEADLDRFGYTKPSDLYARAADMVAEACGITDWAHAPEAAQAVRYLIECAICYDHSPWADANGDPWTGEDTDTTRAIIAAALTATNP